MKRIIIVVFLLSGFIAHSSEAQKVLRKVENKAFKPGEVLKFRIHYGFLDAGSATIEVKQEAKNVGGRDCYHIVGTGQTAGAFNWFFKVRDRYETMIDKQAMVPWLFIRRVDEGGFVINENVSFNHFANKASSNGTRNKKDISRTIDSLPDNIQDMVSAFYYARTMDFSNAKVGDVFPIQGLIDNQVVPLNVRYIGREDLQTKMGTVRCIMFRPMLQQGRIFKDNEDMTVWVSDDKNRLPMRLQADVLVGSIKMDLVDCENLANDLAIVK